MKEKILIFGHKNPDTDSICSALVEEYFNKFNGWNVEAVRLGNINKETQFVLDYLGIEAPRLVENIEEEQKVILVDHNDFNQSVEGIELAKIEAVVDHHCICNFKTSEPLFFDSKPYGSTATVLYEIYKEKYMPKYGMKLERKEAVLMLSAIISDTLLLKSPTTTKTDKQALNELAEIAKIDINEYGLEMLKAGTALDDFTVEELINIDAKKFDKDGIKYVIAQVNTVSIEDVLKRENELKDAINKVIEKENLCLFVLSITDILNSNSEIITLGTKINAIEKGFGVKVEENKAFLEGVVSRKKQLLPKIDKNI